MGWAKQCRRNDNLPYQVTNQHWLPITPLTNKLEDEGEVAVFSAKVWDGTQRSPNRIHDPLTLNWWGSRALPQIEPCSTSDSCDYTTTIRYEVTPG